MTAHDKPEPIKLQLLQPATLSQNSLKLSAQGNEGSGKSLSLTMIAIGLSKQFHHCAPIAFFDTEKQSDFVKGPCDIEGVPLLVVKSKSFIDMRDAFAEAEAAGCCAFIVDSYMHPYIELQEAFKTQADLVGRRLAFHHRDQPQMVWSQWVDTWKASPMHCLFASRLGFKYGQSVDENGDVQHIKLGTRMRGDSDAGYEPNIVIELESIEDTELRHHKTRGKVGTNTHWMRIVKDRMMVLNGRNFPFAELNAYKQGAYQPIYKALSGHIDKLAIGAVPRESLSRSSTGLFSAPRGESAYAERQKRVDVAYGEVDKSIDMLWPSANGTDDKRIRAIVKKILFGVRSDAAILALVPEDLETARRVMTLFETAVADPDQRVNPKDEAAVVACLLSCQDLERERKAEMVL